MHFRVFVFYLLCLVLRFALSWRSDSALLFVVIVYIAAHAMASLPDDYPLLAAPGLDAGHQEDSEIKQKTHFSP